MRFLFVTLALFCLAVGAAENPCRWSGVKARFELKHFTPIQSRANGHFPLMVGGVTNEMLSAFLESNATASDLMKPPSKAEVDQMAKAMDGFHQKCGVAYRLNPQMEGPISDPKTHGVPLERIQITIESQRALSIERLVRLAEQVAAANDPKGGYADKLKHAASGWAGPDDNAALIDKIATSPLPEAKKIRAHVNLIGEALREVQGGTEMQKLSDAWTAYLRENGHPGAEARQKKELEIRTEFKKLYKAALEKKFPDQPQLAEKLAEILGG